ncbi:MAG: hypothetical protein HBSAPP02_28240 [Phycisphaerae bacterium]|nr:MAG: hypothetical protein HBSAPP02_28240 [Phycisphaerae bacterium]
MLTAPFDTDVFPRAPFDAGTAPSTALISSDGGRSSLSESAAVLEEPVPVSAAPVEKSRRALDLLADAGGAADVRAFCINLDRRPDRWEQFLRNCPIVGVERFAAIDGRKCRPPEWWRQGGGAWGCMLSHIGILQHVLMDGLDQRGGVLLVLEDDALFPSDFADKAERFLLAVPKDWDQLYFGGQHRGVRARPPQRINGEVIRPYMVNRTQAYAVRGEFMRVLYRHLCNWPDHARHPRHHVDHRMELLHACGRHNVYAPTRWIIGQAGGKSDVSGRMAQDRFWNYHLPDRQERDVPDAPGPGVAGAHEAAVRGQRRKGRNRRRNGPVRFTPAVRKPPVWVIGLHRSGSSVTAGILHRLGVHMGNRLIGYENRGTGGFEAHGLAKICEQAYPFPSTEPAVDHEVTKRELRAWLDHRMGEAAHRGTIAGGKYPHLCFLVDMLLELESESRFIHIDRPLDESIRSLTDRSAEARGWLRATPDQCDRLQRALDAAKCVTLARVSPERMLTIRYHDLLADPASHVDRIVRFLDLRVGPQQLRAANALVEPSRRRF